MKKTIMTTVLIMILFIFAAPVAFASEATHIKVGLKYANAAKLSYTVMADGGFYVAKSNGTEFEEIEQIFDYDKAVVNYSDTEIKLQTPDGADIFADLDGYVLLPARYEDDGVINIDGSVYRGGLCFTQNGDNTINAINILDVEQYVYGVLNGEMNHAHPKEALKAQAVTARSFALTNAGRHSSNGFDVCVGTHCQVYKGYSDEYKETTEAIDETAGLLMYSEGKVVCGYYSKNSGGHTQSSSDVWGGNVPYLKGVPDKYSPKYPWTTSFSFVELENMLDNARKPVGELKQVMIKARNSAGAVSEVKFEGTEGTATLVKESVRTFFGGGLVKSTMFTFGGAEIENAETRTNGGNDNALDGTFVYNGNNNQQISKNIYVVGSNNNSVQLKSTSAYASNGTLKVKISEGEAQQLPEPTNPGNSEVVTGGSLVINGLGFGHGVGMPQDSAIEMAKQGFTFDDILKYYYTGIEIR
ncbi:MAG: SpoIID/LytB domain-containing protein [Eubacteriales bacterium]|nr:SpoIID/LytB domain-containing protein [Eubacteriales bacterium]